MGVRIISGKQKNLKPNPATSNVLVITKQDDWQLKDRIGKLATAILLEEEVYFSVKVLGLSAYQRLRQIKSPFFINVEREGIVL